ncbi:MAG TPA: ABC transporter permease [Bosea sp. (in: a-proteobacteria)]|uniref:ABC transporter permease n=1 Tax=Bosea sp. (in: a-proteobacteria) TaxID=1871050 RepID=UPI002E139F38|nr:ABC transporter permease [Bosea sp. (in: a-proteobacteria)]
MNLLRRLPWPIVVIALILALPIAYGLTLDPIEASLRNSLKAPSLAFPFGTDQLGRDVLARIAHGFLIDIGLTSAIVTISFSIGLCVGVVTAEFAGRIDRSLTFAMDVLTALPQIVIALILSVHLGGGALPLVLALGLTGWVKYARIARAAAFSLREREFVSAARIAGGSSAYVLIRHVVPQIVPMLAGLVALQFGHTILNIAALGFLGVGIQPPTPEWGAMIAEARPYFSRAPWLAIVPGLFLFALTALALAIARSLTRRGQGAFAKLLTA